MTAGHDELRLLLGAYVLGGLGPADRERLQMHLRACADCRDELAASAAVPGLLRRVPGTAGPTAFPPASLLPRLLDEVRQERRRARRRQAVRALAAAAAAAVLASAAGLGWQLARDPARPGIPPTAAPPPSTSASPITAAAVDAAAGSSTAGRAELVPKQWGTEIALQLTGLPARGPFTLWAVADDGTREQAAAWGPTRAGRARLAAATSIQTVDLDTLQVMGADGRLLAVAHPG